MKRILVSLALVGLAVGAFAQAAPAPAAPAPTLKLNGYISTGVTALANGTDKAVVGLWDDDTPTSVGRFKLLGDYNFGDAGLKFDLRSSGLGLSGSGGSAANGFSNIVYLKSVYAYDYFLSKIFYTQVGVISEQTTRPDASASLRPVFTKETPGAIVVVRPPMVDGLTLNAAIVGLGTSTKTNPAYAISSDAGNLTDVPFTFGGSYTLQGIGALMGQIQFNDTNSFYSVSSGTWGSSSNSTTFGSAYNLSQAYLAAKVTAVPHLVGWLEGWIGGYAVTGGTPYSNGTTQQAQAQTLGHNNIGAYLNDGYNDGLGVLAETVNYNFTDFEVAPLTVGIVGLQYFYGSDFKTNYSASNTSGTAISPSLRFSPWASWAFDGGITPKLMLSYASGPEVLANSFANYNSNAEYGVTAVLDNYLNAYAPVESKNANVANVNNVAIFEIKPSVQFAINPGQTITVLYAFATSVGSEDVYFQNGLSTSSAKTNNVIQVNYVYNF